MSKNSCPKCGKRLRLIYAALGQQNSHYLICEGCETPLFRKDNKYKYVYAAILAGVLFGTIFLFDYFDLSFSFLPFGENNSHVAGTAIILGAYAFLKYIDLNHATYAELQNENKLS
jgi:hypothetical protein